MRAANKQWLHPSEALIRGHILYNVKFLGESIVDSAKGSEVVKDAIRKRKFNKTVKKAEGQKTPRVELTISADGVTIQYPKTKTIMHQYPLHRISYCADDKSDKRMFTFIAKSADSNQHFCYVFDSEKCAEEITLTIGQAFDLAYRRFLETSGKDIDMKRKFEMLLKKVSALEQENDMLRKKVQELEKLKDKEGVDQLQAGYQNNQQAVVGRRLENLVLETSPQHNGTVNNGNQSPGAILSPPPPSARSRSSTHPPPQQQQIPSASSPSPASNDLAGLTNPFAAAPSSSGSVDAFGMGAFNPNDKFFNNSFSSRDKELMDIESGFSQGLSFGTDDFSLADLDPLSAK